MSRKKNKEMGALSMLSNEIAWGLLKHFDGMKPYYECRLTTDFGNIVKAEHDSPTRAVQHALRIKREANRIETP